MNLKDLKDRLWEFVSEYGIFLIMILFLLCGVLIQMAKEDYVIAFSDECASDCLEFDCGESEITGVSIFSTPECWCYNKTEGKVMQIR